MLRSQTIILAKRALNGVIYLLYQNWFNKYIHLSTHSREIVIKDTNTYITFTAPILHTPQRTASVDPNLNSPVKPATIIKGKISMVGMILLKTKFTSRTKKGDFQHGLLRNSTITTQLSSPPTIKYSETTVAAKIAFPAMAESPWSTIQSDLVRKLELTSFQQEEFIRVGIGYW